MADQSERLAALLSQCDEFWTAGSSPEAGQVRSADAGPISRGAAYRRLVCDLIKHQLEFASSHGSSAAEASRLEDYLQDYVDVSFGDSTVLELIECEFALRHERGEWPDLDEYARRFPQLGTAVRERLTTVRDELVTHTSIREVLGEAAAPPKAAAAEAPAAVVPPPLSETLRVIRPFADLSRNVREAVALHARVREFEAGEVLLRQGETADALFILLEGTADVWLNDSGRMHAIAHLERHTVVGELGLVTQEVRSATVVATSRGSAAIIDKEAFEHLAGRYPPLSIALAELIAERVGTLAIDVLCGKTIGGYEIRQRLGRGATGIVYAATETATGRPLALKMLRHDLTFDRHATQRFHQEAEIIRGLAHGNIVKVFDEFAAYGTSFIVMELCDGPSLSELISKVRPLPIPVVRSVVGQLAAGLSCAHAAGIAHRDLKPSNVLLTQDGTVKIADFGLARCLFAEDPGATAFGQIVGTPRYMAPEQLSGERGDARSDLYSLGCIVYEMLAGRPLFAASRFSELLVQRSRWTLPAAPQIRKGLNRPVYRLLEGLLQLDPEARRADLASLAEWAAPVDVAALGLTDAPRSPLERIPLGLPD